MTALEQILSILSNSKKGGQLPVSTTFGDLDFFIIYNPTSGRIEKAQKSTTAGLFLIANNNLSDLDDVSTARTNLDVYSKSETYSTNQTDGLLNDKADLSGGNTMSGDQVLSGSIQINATGVSIPFRIFRSSGADWRVGLQGEDFRFYDSGGLGRDILLSVNPGGTDTLNNVLIGTSVGGGFRFRVNGASKFDGTVDATGQTVQGNFVGDGSQLTNVNANTLDSLNSTDFVRSTGDVSQSVTGVKRFEGSETIIQGDLISENNIETTGNITSNGNMESSGNISLNNNSVGSPATGNFISRDGSIGWSGSWLNNEGATVTVKNGIITDVS